MPTVRNPLQIEFAIFRNLHMTPMRSFFLVSVSIVMILGTLIFLSFSVARDSICGANSRLNSAIAFVPYIEDFSCAFGILFTLLAAPNKALLCLIVYQATQFVENHWAVNCSVSLA